MQNITSEALAEDKLTNIEVIYIVVGGVISLCACFVLRIICKKKFVQVDPNESYIEATTLSNPTPMADVEVLAEVPEIE